MFRYAICEIGGKQYKVLSNKPFQIDLRKVLDKKIEADILLLVEEGKLKIGHPHLKEKLSLILLENVASPKIRVAKYHAKANYRRVKGIRPKFTKVIADVKKVLT